MSHMTLGMMDSVLVSEWTGKQQGQEGYSGTTFREDYLLQHAKSEFTVQRSSITVSMNISMVNQDNSRQEVNGTSVLQKATRLKE